jgi:hypothetical protein
MFNTAFGRPVSEENRYQRGILTSYPVLCSQVDIQKFIHSGITYLQYVDYFETLQTPMHIAPNIWC